MSVGTVLWGVKSIFYVLSDDDKKEYKCVIKGKTLNTEFNLKNRREVSPLVAGDRVDFDKSGPTEGLINRRLKRINEIKRLKSGGREVQTLAANIDQLVIVDSIYNPPFRTFFIDRCLFTADCMNVKSIIVFNKIDLLDEAVAEFYKFTVGAYEKLGYKTLETSIVTGAGIDELRETLKGKISSFNGHSGVGKSSLIAKLDPNFSSIKIGGISKKFDRGVHTTTYAQMYRLEEDTMIADTPGIREFSIFIDKPEDVENNFRDFDDYRPDCKYPNCQHRDEPDCAVRKAVETGDIYGFRYESYLRIRETIAKLKDSRIL
ncbi:MAG TPA: ribosome small subunit-dependent GTPase A [Spirochaetota bacterium]|nr:ribosome small subunit-dependent GTPase A [Spirochaetota bacterium]HOS33611.1 ribosome small subunit-dependent GTPase A [Spirochaetota bacterium]HOS56744.1 ribosome small subunit-dependent GTPase A [Spirochaetota bacterium]HPK62462.1 ribosome small subunit-dependent GTPase A [Spirochaetota bacterium]HQF77970.1 ribosome small subunit-dependent GTPase A [Spirochaetota bacterium]